MLALALAVLWYKMQLPKHAQITLYDGVLYQSMVRATTLNMGWDVVQLIKSY